MINARFATSLFVFATLALCLSFPQQDRMGQTFQGPQGGRGGSFGVNQGSGGGGVGGQQGSGQQGDYQNSQNIEQAIDSYLNPNPITAILTPGEFVEYTVKLKKDEVIVADAKNDAFDPALEVVDVKGKVLDQNDDRFPGDQRPLLMYRRHLMASISSM